MTAAENSRNSACSSGTSGPLSASTVSEPEARRWRTRTRSVIAPPTTKPRLRKISVIVGSIALGTACRWRTIVSISPLARAVCR